MIAKIKTYAQTLWANPMFQKAARAFVVAAIPLVIAAYEKYGVTGITAAVLLSACAAGVRAAFHALPWAKGF
jgi:hypothetical protein